MATGGRDHRGWKDFGLGDRQSSVTMALMAMGVICAVAVLVLTVSNRELILGNRQIVASSYEQVESVIQEHSAAIDTLKQRFKALDTRIIRLEEITERGDRKQRRK